MELIKDQSRLYHEQTQKMNLKYFQRLTSLASILLYTFIPFIIPCSEDDIVQLEKVEINTTYL